MKYNNFGGMTFEQLNEASSDTNREIMETAVVSNPVDMDKRLMQFTSAGSGIGFAMGVGYAFYKQTGFWKGWGIAIVSGIAIGGLTRGIGFLTMKK